MTTKVIELEANDKKLLESLSRINKALDEAQASAKKVRVSGRTEASAKNTANAFSSMSKSAQVMVTSITTAWLAIKSISSGLRDLESGLYKVIHLKANEAFLDLAHSIQSASGSLIDINSAIDIARRAKGIGFISDKETSSISRYATLLGLTNGKMHDTGEIAGKVLKALESGNVEEEFFKLDNILASQIKRFNEQNKSLDKQAKQRAILNLIIQRSNVLNEENGNILENGFTKTLGVLKRLKEESGGLFEIWGGLGKVAGGIAAPLAAGLGGFKLGLVPGILTTLIGGAITTALGAGAIGIASKAAGPNQETRLPAIKTLMTGYTEGFLEALMGLKPSFTISDKDLMAAFPGKSIEEARKAADKPFQVIAALGKGLNKMSSALVQAAKDLGWFDLSAQGMTDAMENAKNAVVLTVFFLDAAWRILKSIYESMATFIAGPFKFFTSDDKAKLLEDQRQKVLNDFKEQIKPRQVSESQSDIPFLLRRPEASLKESDLPSYSPSPEHSLSHAQVEAFRKVLESLSSLIGKQNLLLNKQIATGAVGK
jgi:hypothetical protein